MRLVFMGTPDFAAASLAALIDSPHRLMAVVTQPDRPRGRGQKLQPSPVKALAQSAGLPVLQPQKVRDKDFIEELRISAPDLIVVVAFGQKIPEEILSLSPYGCINVHASLLPRWRGASPIQYAIMAGDEETGVSTMYLDQGWDTGDIILQRKLALAPDETGGSLHDKLAQLGRECLLDTIEGIANGTSPRIPQPREGAIYAPKLDDKITVIDWQQEAAAIERVIRALTPFPGARTFYNGKMLRIWQASIAEGAGKMPGTILRTGAFGIVVQAKDRGICIEALQRSGGSRMEAASFLNGHPLEVGAVLGKDAD